MEKCTEKNAHIKRGPKPVLAPKKHLKIEDLKKNFLGTKWQTVTEILNRKAHLLVYLGIIRKLIRRHFVDVPIFLREQDGILVVAVRVTALDFEARCTKTASLLQQVQERVPEDVAAEIGVSVI